jgi:ATP-dependent DNA helicase RecG
MSEKCRRSVGEEITKRQNLILNYIKGDNRISAMKISNLLQISDRTIERDIQKLKDIGILERVGGDRGGYWKINKP